MSVILEMNREFSNVAHMQKLIGNCDVKSSKLKNIINDLNRKEVEFAILSKYYSKFCNAKDELCAYKDSFWFKYFGFLPYIKGRFNKINNTYRVSLSEFKCELAKRGISDEKSYLIRVNNFNRHCARKEEFEKKLVKMEEEKNTLVNALKKLNVRIWDECLSGLPGDVLSVARGLTSEQVLVLKELDLPKIDYKSLSTLYEEYSSTLKNLKDEYAKASCSLVNFSNVSRAISLYKKACLNSKILSAEDGRMLVNKVKTFMLKHNIRNIGEVHKKQLELKREMEDTLQKMDDMSTKKDSIRPLLDIFKNNIQKCGEKQLCKKKLMQ